jgi:hypothetical protein
MNLLLAVADAGSFKNSVAEQQVGLAGTMFFRNLEALNYYYKSLITSIKLLSCIV